MPTFAEVPFSHPQYGDIEALVRLGSDDGVRRGRVGETARLLGAAIALRAASGVPQPVPERRAAMSPGQRRSLRARPCP